MIAVYWHISEITYSTSCSMARIEAIFQVNARFTRTRAQDIDKYFMILERLQKDKMTSGRANRYRKRSCNVEIITLVLYSAQILW